MPFKIFIDESIPSEPTQFNSKKNWLVKQLVTFRPEQNETEILVELGESIIISVPSLQLKPYVLDYTLPEWQFRQKRLAQDKELILKAVGFKKNVDLNILDLMAGLGRDGFIMASSGCQVISIERSPIIYFMLEQAIIKLQQHFPGCYSWSALYQHAYDYLDQLQLSDYPDVIYLDPMFPERRKRAQVKKEARLLQMLCFVDENDAMNITDIFQLARQKAKRRVVVKRPLQSDFLTQEKPGFSIFGKSVRFDIYINL